MQNAYIHTPSYKVNTYFSLYSTFRVMHQDSIDECFIWAFLLRSRRATGYAIASVRCTMLTHALRMPNAYA
jgi:hypothetical protein